MKALSMIILCLACLWGQAQDKTPKGFKKGVVVLEDSTVLAGYIREHIRHHASLTFIGEEGKGRRELDGSEIRSAEFDGLRYMCIKGDFFRIVSEGEFCYLQKSSDAAGRPVYNGTEPLLINGTEGRPGDYFIYNSRMRSLKPVDRKSLEKLNLTGL